MKRILVGLLLGLVSTPAWADRWSGDLVDSRCSESEATNVSPDYITVPAARNVGFDIRACRPRANKTKSFEVVLPGGESLKLDPAGNAKAAELVRVAGKGQHYFAVEITGTLIKRTIRVDSIAAASERATGN